MKRSVFCCIVTLAMTTILTVLVASPKDIQTARHDPLGMARSFVFHYGVSLEDVPPDAKTVKAWIPIPRSDAHQQIGAVKVSDGLAHEIVFEELHGNRFIVVNLIASKEAIVSYRVDRKPNNTLLSETNPPKQSKKELSPYLAPNRLIPLEGAIVVEALRVAGHEDDPLTRARSLYDNIVATVKYDKSGIGWGRGDAVYACDERAGNCTDFHSLFIAEARSIGIPARFIMGFPIPNDPNGIVGGYHCWAEFYVEDRGWVPIDASEAHKHPEKHDAFFGGLDANRVAVTLGRDIAIPGTDGEVFNYVIYPHVEVDGKRHESVTTTFSYEAAEPTG